MGLQVCRFVDGVPNCRFVDGFANYQREHVRVDVGGGSCRWDVDVNLLSPEIGENVKGDVDLRVRACEVECYWVVGPFQFILF